MILALVPGVANAAHFAEEGNVCTFGDDASFPDVDSDSIFQVQIECIAGFGIILGDAAGNFNPTENVTRGEAAIFVTRTMEAATGEELVVGENPFDDVSEDGAAGPSILKLVEAGVVNGKTDTMFAPGDSITRGEIAAILFRALTELGLAPVVPEESQFSDVDGIFADAINALSNFDGTPQVVNGFDDGTFRPGLNVTRAQLAVFTAESIYQLNEEGLFDAAEDDAVVDANSGTVVARTPAAPAAATSFDYTTAAGVRTNGVTFAENTDTFTIDGASASAAAFAAQVTVADSISLEKTDADADFDVFNLTNNDAPTSGLVGAVDIQTPASTAFSIVTANNDAIANYTIDGSGAPSYGIDAGGVTFTVDGAAATQSQFVAAIGHGDTIDVTLGDTDNDNTDEVESFNLTNASVSGTAANVVKDDLDITDDDDDAAFTIGKFGDTPNDGINNASTFGLDTRFIVEGQTTTTAPAIAASSQSFTVDGNVASAAQFVTALTVGDDVTYSRTSGVESFALTNQVVDQSFSGITADADAAALTGATTGFDPVTVANTLEYLPTGESTITTFDYSTGVSTFTINGVVSTQTEFTTALNNNLLSIGAAVSFNDSTNTLALTTSGDSGELNIADITGTLNTVASDEFFDLVVGTTVIARISGATVFDNANGVATTAKYFVNGTEVSADDYDDFVNDILNSNVAAEDGGDTFRAVVTAGSTEHRLTTNNDGVA